MNKKSVAAVLAAAVLCAGLTGCGKNAIPDMTDEQVKSIGEYVAITMMKYDANHRSRLVDLPLLEQNPYVPSEPVATKEPSGMGQVDDTTVIDPAGDVENPYTIEEVLALPDGVTLEFSGQRLCDVYPDTGESGGFALNAAAGKKILVLSFIINNTTGQDQKVDLFSSGAVFKVTVNGSYSRRALATGMLDDMATYKGTIPANSDKETVILVEVGADMASAIESISLNVKNDTKVYTSRLL